MKCFVLAGGSSDRLWPLSRKDYPKQFMEIREGRSMFQDTILRNMPFCDEFIVITSKKYENIVRGQLQAFQSLDYTLILEEVSLNTAPAVIACALQLEDDEPMLIVSTDSIVVGDYKTSIVQLRDAVNDDKLAAIVCKPPSGGEGYTYINRVGKKIVYGEKKTKYSLCDCGILGAKPSVLLSAVDAGFVEECRKLRIINHVIEKDETVNLLPVSLGKVLRTERYSLINASFEWTRITDISSFYYFYDKTIRNDYNTISNNSRDVEIVNMVDDQLIIANGLKNVTIVNTRDAIYVTDRAREADIKAISNEYYASKRKYFDVQPKRYESWGTEEVLCTADDCCMRMITVYPRAAYQFKAKKNVVANFFLMHGKARLESDKDEIDYGENENITILDSSRYAITNIGKSNLVFVCTLKNPKSAARGRHRKTESLVKMQPSFKDNLWGGTKLRDVFGKDVGNMDVIAESWELSAHPAGESRIASGYLEGKTLSEYIAAVGKEKLGWKTQTYERFPIMIKFIDAKQNLSIQVHPADEYAITYEGDYGKNEMWYILDADEDACIYVGFNRDVTSEELREHIANHTLMKLLNRIPVKKGESYFLKAGTVHAIGAGCLICEIQQSSNVTYRLYDYGRKDKNGRERELHLEKALDVLDMKESSVKTYERYEALIRSEYVKTLIGQCKYFTVMKYSVDGECVLPVSEASFRAVVFIEGKGVISDGTADNEAAMGDTWFSIANVQITIKGKCTALVVNI